MMIIMGHWRACVEPWKWTEEETPKVQIDTYPCLHICILIIITVSLDQ